MRRNLIKLRPQRFCKYSKVELVYFHTGSRTDLLIVRYFVIIRYV